MDKSGTDSGQEEQKGFMTDLEGRLTGVGWKGEAIVMGDLRLLGKPTELQ